MLTPQLSLRIICAYFGKTEKIMTEAQLEIQATYLGLRQDGCSKEQALSYILLMQFDAKDVVWLVQEIS
jgi:hypothetical protein